MPVDYSRYPANWNEIRQQILERDNHKCKWCGVENYAVGFRDRNGRFCSISEFESLAKHIQQREFGFQDDDGGYYMMHSIKIILTIAHLGIPKYPGDTGNKHDKMDCRLNNLAALCQKCHLNFDVDEHIENRRKTRELQIAQSGQLNFFDYMEEKP